MTYTDNIYGTIEIDDPVIVDLINSEPLQRLKDINQYGASFYRFPHLTTNRFEHSVGVYIVLKQLGASLPEQIVGLLHDIPHTAFSHVTDIVFEDVSQTFHEKFQEKVIFDSDIPAILKRHGLSIWPLLRKSNFHLAERDLPDLCADRIDYFFRDCVVDNQLDLTLAQSIWKDMTVVDGEIVFTDPKLARDCAVYYREANQKLWANPLQSALYFLLATGIKLALEERIVTFDELFTTDKIVYDKMASSGNPQITKLLYDMEHITIKEDAVDYDYHVKPKVRIVDPWVLTPTGKERISHLDNSLQAENNQIRERLETGYFVKVI